MCKPLAIIGIPTSAGAFSPGQEKAPKALRDARFIEQLICAGIEVVDHGDGAVYRWRPDKANRFAQNLDAVVEIAKQTATRVQQAIIQGQIPLVLGGDCTFDVDVIDFVDLPLSEERIRNEGLSFDQAMQALTAFVGSKKFSALTITELNPDHGEESGATIDVFVKALDINYDRATECTSSGSNCWCRNFWSQRRLGATKAGD